MFLFRTQNNTRTQVKSHSLKKSAKQIHNSNIILPISSDSENDLSQESDFECNQIKDEQYGKDLDSEDLDEEFILPLVKMPNGLYYKFLR
ncbi:16515_t:CDS:2 [Gigaspora rosea]|nr:16515_t:CDS:2 [Gigaspora rosea]